VLTKHIELPFYDAMNAVDGDKKRGLLLIE
jgi:hypothetical protein